jgi:hypothetical protein
MLCEVWGLGLRKAESILTAYPISPTSPPQTPDANNKEREPVATDFASSVLPVPAQPQIPALASVADPETLNPKP